MEAEKYMTFLVGGETYGIPIGFVTEIVGVQPITPLPVVPEYVRGIMNLRGRIIPIVDIRLKFGWEAIPYNDRTCIVIVDVSEVMVGLVVDQVAEVLSIPEADTMPPPGYRVEGRASYIQKIGKVGDQVKLILDCAALLVGEGECLVDAS